MVNLLHFFREDFLAPFRKIPQPHPDLYTYHFRDPRGYQRRIHLRIEPDRAGVLFVDVTDVIHLNQTAARIAKAALDTGTKVADIL